MVMAAVPVGFFAGLFGIGGGLISVPFLFFIFDFLNLTEDYTMHLAVGTAFFITIFTSTASVLTHRKHKAVDLSILQQENSNKIKPSFGFFSKAILGFISGSISAPMGITGAMMNVPILRFFGYPITKAIGSAAAIGWIISISGTIGFFSTGLYLDVSLPLSIGFVNIPAFLIFIPITTIMARIGVNTVHKMSKIKAQRMFGVFLYVIGTIFIFRYFSL